MENITLGQISNVLLFIVEFVGVVTAVMVTMKKVLNKQLSPLNKKIDKLDENQCRNYLVDFLADIEKGIEKDETQIKRSLIRCRNFEKLENLKIFDPSLPDRIKVDLKSTYPCRNLL